jgi:hypothetical protein
VSTELLKCLLIFSALAAPDAEEVRRAADSVFEEAEYQVEIPDGESHPEKIDAPSWLGDLFSFTANNALGVLLTVVAVGLIILAVSVAAGGARRRLRKGKGEEDESDESGPDGPGDLPDPEALAEEGRFAEALRALLLAALAEIPTRLGRALPVALTSREILRGTNMPGPARDQLMPLVMIVERSLFGGGEVGRADYDEGVDHLRRYREGWEAAT